MNLSELLKLWRVEKAAAQPVKLPPQFYMDAHALLENKDQYEAKKAREIYNDLISMRQHKMLMACLRQMKGGDKPENLLGNEKEVYENIRKELDALREGSLEIIEKGEEQKPETVDGQETLQDSAEKPVPEYDSMAAATEEAAPPEKPAEPKAVKKVADTKGFKRVKFLRSMPAFVGPDLETLGPFDEDEVTEMDGKVADVLLKNDAIELVYD